MMSHPHHRDTRRTSLETSRVEILDGERGGAHCITRRSTDPYALRTPLCRTVLLPVLGTTRAESRPPPFPIPIQTPHRACRSPTHLLPWIFGDYRGCGLSNRGMTRWILTSEQRHDENPFCGVVVLFFFFVTSFLEWERSSSPNRSASSGT